MKFELSDDQVKIVMQCFDVAVKHGGLNAASAILPIAVEFETQYREQQKIDTTPKQ